jgi:uncharacterized protein (TIGR02001 family)
LLLTASCVSCAWTARAADTPEVLMPATAPASLFSGDVQFKTNYVARGISQSQGQPSVQAEIDANPGDGVYGGLAGDSINWVDQAYPGDSVDTEVDGWLGYRERSSSGWISQVGFKRIQFPGHYVQQSPPVDQPNSTEAFGSVAWYGLSAQLNYAVTNYVNTPGSRGTVYLGVAVSQPMGASWTLVAALGRVREAGQDPVTGRSNSRLNNTDYKLSIACDLGSGISLTLAHTWTNADLNVYTLNGYALAGHHTWLSLEKDF